MNAIVWILTMVTENFIFEILLRFINNFQSLKQFLIVAIPVSLVSLIIKFGRD